MEFERLSSPTLVLEPEFSIWENMYKDKWRHTQIYIQLKSNDRHFFLHLEMKIGKGNVPK